MKDDQLIKTAKKISKEVSYFFYRLNKICSMIENLIQFEQLRQSMGIGDIAINTESHIELIDEDIRDLNNAVEAISGNALYQGDVDWFIQYYKTDVTNLNTHSDEFKQYWYHCIFLILDSLQEFRKSKNSVFERLKSITEDLYVIKLDQLTKNKIITLVEDANRINEMIMNSILIPIGSTNPGGY